MAKPPLPDKVVQKREQPNRILVDMDHSRKQLQHPREDPRVEIERWHGWGATKAR